VQTLANCSAIELTCLASSLTIELTEGTAKSRDATMMIQLAARLSGFQGRKEAFCGGSVS
jgi:hypothetical protein